MSTTTPKPPVLLKRPEVSARTKRSRSSIYRGIASGEFPAPVQIGPRSVAWLESDVDAWIESRAVGIRPTGAQAA